jgi:hypothetical protein
MVYYFKTILNQLNLIIYYKLIMKLNYIFKNKKFKEKMKSLSDSVFNFKISTQFIINMLTS